MDLNLVFSSLTLFSTSITAFLIFLQYREQTKPILRIEVKDLDKHKETQSVLESSERLGLFITNNSKKVATNLRVKCNIEFDKKKESYKFFINRLYPNEYTKRPVGLFKQILDKYPNMFEEHSFKDNSKKYPIKDFIDRRIKIPKKTLNIVFTVYLTYNKSFLGLFKFKIIDTYLIEWGSLSNYPELSSHPRNQSYNKRNGEYIYKK